MYITYHIYPIRHNLVRHCIKEGVWVWISAQDCYGPNRKCYITDSALIIVWSCPDSQIPFNIEGLLKYVKFSIEYIIFRP